MQTLPEFWLNSEIQPLLVRATRVVVILIIALLAAFLAKRIIRAGGSSLLEEDDPHDRGANEEHNKRISTLAAIAAKAAEIVIWSIAVVMALREAGFDVVPLLAGAGVAGLAIGFGAQNLVRDVISGAFMLLENQIRVGDVATINGTGGAVQEVNLRTTVLRDFEGTVHVFPNGAITTLSNRTQQFSNYVFDVSIAYKEDPERVMGLLRQIGAEIAEEPEWKTLITVPLDVLGVDRFADSAVVIKMRIQTEPGKQWMVGREINLRIKKTFDREGVEIPFPHRTVYFGDPAIARGAKAGEIDREALRQLVREECAAVVREVTTGGSPAESDNRIVEK